MYRSNSCLESGDVLNHVSGSVKAFLRLTEVLNVFLLDRGSSECCFRDPSDMCASHDVRLYEFRSAEP